jgi:hypothetical protein
MANFQVLQRMDRMTDGHWLLILSPPSSSRWGTKNLLSEVHSTEGFSNFAYKFSISFHKLFDSSTLETVFKIFALI